jgi:protein-L-isoaspartate(D-aspartate) O-methyltransferase
MNKIVILTFIAACLLFFIDSVLLCEVCHAQDNSKNDPFARARTRMIDNDLKGRDITDPSVLRAMEKVKRDLFVDESRKREAYGDYPLPIGEQQTISQPYIVALMTQYLELNKKDKVLEVGTGSGYQAAVLGEIAGEVYSIEINKNLAKKASNLLKSLGYENIKVKAGDGFFGWQEYAPFDAILLTCSVDKIPEPLVNQLKEGGKIILPLGEMFEVQSLILGTKKGGRIEIKNITPVRFVPMRGEAEKAK